MQTSSQKLKQSKRKRAYRGFSGTDPAEWSIDSLEERGSMEKELVEKVDILTDEGLYINEEEAQSYYNQASHDYINEDAQMGIKISDFLEEEKYQF